jgi:hypothetical protein
MIRNDTSCYVTPIQNWEVRLGMTTTRPACPPRIPTQQLMQSINASSQYTYIHLYSSRDVTFNEAELATANVDFAGQ